MWQHPVVILVLFQPDTRPEVMLSFQRLNLLRNFLRLGKNTNFLLSIFYANVVGQEDKGEEKSRDKPLA